MPEQRCPVPANQIDNLECVWRFRESQVVALRSFELDVKAQTALLARQPGPNISLIAKVRIFSLRIHLYPTPSFLPPTPA
jgi:hypothetical protein